MRRYLYLLPLVGLACGLGGSGKRPNLLVVTIDTLRRDAIGCYGAPGPLTSSFDRVARDGILFANASSQVPITLPSHATLFTGRYPALHGARHNGMALRLEETTLAERLSARGYATAGFVGSQVLANEFQIGQGFEVYEDRWRPSARGLHGLWERAADSVATSFIEWFEHRNRKRPFFAWAHFYDPHALYTPPRPFEALAGSGYAGEVAFVDRGIGRILGAVEESGLYEETVIVLLADHGEGLGAHGESEHGILLYETTLAIPWVLKLPGGPRGVIVTAPVETVDLLPTLAEVLSIEAESPWPGENLLPIVRGEKTASDRPLFAESYYGNVGYRWAPLYAVREGAWKLVQGRWDELFDIDSDPAEREDLVTERPEIAQRLSELLDAFTAESAGEIAPRAELTAEQREMLEALGYAAPASGPTAGEDLPDPRERFGAHEKIIQSRLHTEGGRRDLAREDLQEALRIDPKNVDAHLLLAPLYRESGEIDRECEMYLAILAIDPDHAPAWNNLGILKEIDGDLAGALECYERSLQGDSTFADAYVNRGNVYTTQGNLDDAMRAFEKALRLNPRSGPAHYGKAMVLNKRGEFERVVEELKLALHLDPKLTQAREWLRALERSAQTGI